MDVNYKSLRHPFFLIIFLYKLKNKKVKKNLYLSFKHSVKFYYIKYI